MALESASFIEDLVVTNPTGTDAKSQGDNHLRLIKQVLLNQFPNLGAAAVTSTAAELDAAVAGATPEGAISMWAGTIAQVPTGWQLCNGTGTTNNLSIAVPNLTSKFIVGSITDTGGTYDIGDTGGSTDIDFTSGSTALTIAQMPLHGHPTRVNTTTETTARTFTTGGIMLSTGNPNSYAAFSGTVSNTAGQQVGGTGGGTGHTHAVSATGGNLPPYYALAFIIYLG